MGAPPAAEGVRTDWHDLPVEVRQAVEGALGSEVVAAATQRGGFSPGVASRLELADGTRAFVKAVHPSANPMTPAIHLREAAVLGQLPATVPAPRLLGQLTVDGWVVLCIEDVDGTQPTLPWHEADVERVVRAIEQLTLALTPAPLAAPTLEASLGDQFRGFRKLTAQSPRARAGLDPWVEAHLGQLSELEATWVEHATGDTLLHCDLRADNILLTGDGVVFVDWPHAVIGPAWFDLVAMLPSIVMQGGPRASDVFDHSAWATSAPRESVDALLCALAGYFVAGARRPEPPGLPTLRAFQCAQGDAALEWLRSRLGW